jgi:uncharacterized repeat protein (TIGR03803 family)
MQYSTFRRELLISVCAIAATILWGSVVYGGPADGQQPVSDVAVDSSGDVYGVTPYGGQSNFGAVFKIDPARQEVLLHTFTGGSDGAYPSGIIYDESTGNIFGMTSEGGNGSNCFSGCGVVYRLSPDGIETVLHNFDVTDGIAPVGKLVRDESGTLYGVSSQGGAFGYGALFRLKASGDFAVLHSFAYHDGAYPASGPIQDGAGNLYGTTEAGGGYDGGVVYKIAAIGDSTSTVVHTFTGGSDGSGPKGGLALDDHGNLYGAAYFGGDRGYGVVYKISPHEKFRTLYSFTDGADGASPAGDLIEAGGKLYGTVYRGGAFDDGAVFEITKSGTETVLHSFAGGGGGIYPYSGVTLGPNRFLYGVTSLGGHGVGLGTAFRLKRS